MFSKVHVSLHILTSGVWDFDLVHILANTWYCQYFNFRHSRDVECYIIIVLIYTCLQVMIMSIFHVLVDFSYFFLLKDLFKSFDHLKLGYLLLLSHIFLFIF